MILSPEFVENLSVIKQGSGSTIAASTQSDHGANHESKKNVRPDSNLSNLPNAKEAHPPENQNVAICSSDQNLIEKDDKAVPYLT